jgi:hypothetical protein
MDYTTLDRVKLEAIKTDLDTDDDLLELLITGASRAIDRKATGAVTALDYFLLEDVANETLQAIVNNEGTIRTAPHKPVINSIASMSYRFSPAEAWIPIDSELLLPDDDFVLAWGALSGHYPGKCFVQISYNGGLAEDPDDLPGDLIELATLLTARFYKEAETGLTDAIGVAELGTLIYTKAWPVRFIEMLQPFMRVVPWRGA